MRPQNGEWVKRGCEWSVVRQEARGDRFDPVPFRDVDRVLCTDRVEKEYEWHGRLMDRDEVRLNLLLPIRKLSMREV
jgi:hypothetical protein